MDIKFVRDQFPALKNDFIFMDNAGGSQTLGKSINYITDYLTNSNVQLGASYNISALAGKRLKDVTQQIAEYVNADNEKEMVIGPSSTMLLRILSICISENWKSGDEVIITNTDHEANVSCWTDLQKKGVIIKVWRVDPESLELNIEDLKSLISTRTKLVAVTHTSNVLGSINPIEKFAEIIHEAGALICVDGVAFAPHREVDVKELGVDFYVFSWYKVYGPHVAVMYGKLELLTAMRGINHYFFQPEDVPYKFQPGNFNFELTYGLKGISEYLIELHDHHNPERANISKRDKINSAFDQIANYEATLSKKLIDYLNDVPEVKIIGHSTSDAALRVPTISFVHEKFRSEEIVECIDKEKIGIRFGDFYAKKLIQDLGLDNKGGVVRVSLVHYNSKEEVEKLIRAFKKIF